MLKAPNNPLNFKGHGIDIVDIKKFSILLNEETKPFLNRYFTTRELDSVGDGPNQLEKLAGRFAIKESVLKALGVGWGRGVSFTDVETYNLSSGAPAINLYRSLAVIEADRQITGWLVSSSHTEAIAMASVIAIGPPENTSIPA